MSNDTIVNDITGMNPIKVSGVITPISIDEIVSAVKESASVSIGGGRFSMGGQIAAPDSTHIDMRQFNRVVEFLPEKKIITVQTGIRWQDILEIIDTEDLSIKIMQTYSTFSVGGSLSVNVHGRYIGLGPVILSVLSIQIVLASGEVVTASPTENSEIFYGAIGGYGGLGVIVQATLALTDNVKLERFQSKMATQDYLTYFHEHIRASGDVVFHNADMYPPHYENVSSISWKKTNKATTEKRRITKAKLGSKLHRYFLWAIARSYFGKWRREKWIDPLFYRVKRVVYRNYEASYDIAELQPVAILDFCYILQEYFVPVEQFDNFIPIMKEILNRHKVNVTNISVRHAYCDPGSKLAWAKNEVFAFVIYYRDKTSSLALNQVAVWTRELIDAAIALGGSYYLPYQLHASEAQFHKAYPQAVALFDLKRQLDPGAKFTNSLWNKYYPLKNEPTQMFDSRFKTIFYNTAWRDRFFLFLQNIFNVLPENKLHYLIYQLSKQHDSDEVIYREIQKQLASISVLLADLRYGLPALGLQKTVMVDQTYSMMNQPDVINGYVEIAGVGRYIKALSKKIKMKGPVYLVTDTKPSNSPPDIVERGKMKPTGDYININDYEPIAQIIASESIEVVSCYGGLHHCPPDKMSAFIDSIHRILQPGGYLLLREHDVTDPMMNTFVGLAHDVFNAGTKETWEFTADELRHFKSVEQWVAVLQSHGFVATQDTALQQNDPTLNTLICFQKK